MSARKSTRQLSFDPDLSDLVRPDHPYRRLMSIVSFDVLCAPLRSKYSELGRDGYAVCSMFKALVVQWMEDLSDRELERFLEENLAGKLFCGFSLHEPTPDYSTFCTFRSRIGTQGLGELFREIRQSLEQAGLVHEAFTFVDATHLITKSNLWKERDRVIAEKQQKLNNSNISGLTADKDARLGKKGRLKWFGYKIHAGVDMAQGFICRVAVTPANVEDTVAARHVLPRKGMVFGDKAYGVGASARAMRRLGLHSGAILKKDMSAKNHDKDRWLSSVRMPFEGTFSKFQKRARYRGLAKCQFQAFMQAIAHNFKRLVAIQAAPLEFRPQYACG
jgi:transposase, IS5 family